MPPKSTRLMRVSAFFLLSTTFFLSGCSAESEKKSNFGDSHAVNQTQKKTDSAKKNAGESPNNIIVFIGDGMGISTITAGRIFVGQEKGLAGEEYELSFDKFPQLALIKTYNTSETEK